MPKRETKIDRDSREMTGQLASKQHLNKLLEDCTKCEWKRMKNAKNDVEHKERTPR